MKATETLLAEICKEAVIVGSARSRLRVGFAKSIEAALALLVHKSTENRGVGSIGWAADSPAHHSTECREIERVP